jgi:hypothetical protein
MPSIGTIGVRFMFNKAIKEKTIDDVFKAHWRLIVCRVGIKKPTKKNPPKKTQKNPPKKPLKAVFLGFFWVFLNF